jgi:hypothetical protein
VFNIFKNFTNWQIILKRQYLKYLAILLKVINMNEGIMYKPCLTATVMIKKAFLLSFKNKIILTFFGFIFTFTFDYFVNQMPIGNDIFVNSVNT